MSASWFQRLLARLVSQPQTHTRVGEAYKTEALEHAVKMTADLRGLDATSATSTGLVYASLSLRMEYTIYILLHVSHIISICRCTSASSSKRLRGLDLQTYGPVYFCATVLWFSIIICVFSLIFLIIISFSGCARCFCRCTQGHTHSVKSD